MNKNKTIDDLWEELKATDEYAESVINTSQMISQIINSLIKARLDLGLTQEQLAQKVSMKQSAIARLESLRTVPKLDTVINIANALGVKIEARTTTLGKNEHLHKTELAVTQTYSYSANIPENFTYTNVACSW